MKYRVELSIKNMEKGEKIHILGIFGGHVRVHPEGVPVHPEGVPVHPEGVPVHPSRTQCVLVHVRGVPVHPVLFFLFRPVFVV